MKGKMKKLVALALAAIMVLAMGITVSAEGESKTITVTNTVTDATYTLYKVFDVTNNGGDGYNYTIPAGSTIASLPGFSGENGIFDTSTNGGATYVTLKSRKNATDVANWLNTVKDSLTPVTGGTKTSDGTDVVFNVSETGYYYISGSAGTSVAAMLDTLSGNSLTIQAKNDKPGWGNGGKKAVDAQGNPLTGDNKTYYLGDTIHYQLTYEKALNYADGNLITKYVIKDTPDNDAGIEIQKDTLNIKVIESINGKEVVTNVVTNGTAETAYVNKVTGLPTANSTTGLDITLIWAERGATEDTFVYGNTTPKSIVVTYDAKITSLDGVGNTGIKNTASITYNDNKPSGPDDTDTETVYTGKITINKVDGSDNTKALRATFVIALNADHTSFLKYDANAAESKFSTVTNQADATSFVTGPLETGEASVANTVYGTTLGSVEIGGLKAGTYYLLETEAPKGYNLLPTHKDITLSADTTGEKTIVMAQEPTIENNAGTTLPSTGGIGTTIFYVAGGLLVAGAGILLITRKRMRKEQ